MQSCAKKGMRLQALVRLLADQASGRSEGERLSWLFNIQNLFDCLDIPRVYNILRFRSV
jgi:hypothetical protein